MKKIAVVSQKGGAGKTSLSVNLASIAAQEGLEVAIIDLDNQTSSCLWGDRREGNEELPGVSVASVQPNRLTKVLGAIEEKVDLCLIDTSPNSESATLSAVKNADFSLIPCRPSYADVAAIVSTVELINISKQSDNAGIVINCAKNKSVSIDARKALGVYQLPIAPVVIGDRIVFSRSFAQGMGVFEYEKTSKASNEIQSLYRWLKSFVDD